MSNLLNSAVYCWYQDVQDTTNIETLQTEDETVIERYITEAQNIIDDYIIEYGEMYDNTQINIFPIKDSDGVELMPNDIKIATVYIVEKLFLIWSPTSIEAWSVKEEKVWDHTVKYETWWVDEFLIPEKAKNILDRYRRTFYKQDI